MAALALDADSDSDDLSVFSRSPSPPSDPFWYDFSVVPDHRLPSPPSSHASPSPSPETTPRKRAAPNAKPCSTPSKRRKVADAMPRETKYLDLSVLDHDIDTPNTDELRRLVTALQTKRKIVVVAGAGISVSAGIPDFRSSTGLFNSLKRQRSLKASGKQLFDASVYRDEGSTTSFHDMVRSLSNMTKTATPTLFHNMIARLAQEDRLLRLYSQNVDGIDISLSPLATQVPLPAKGPWPKTVQLHGGLGKMSCTKCNELLDFEAKLFEGPVPPECSNCVEMDRVRAVAGKRSHGIGRLRPRMVLYNEHNPDDEAIGAVARADLRARPDAIIVVGTSLKIPGVRRIVREMCGIVRDRRDGLAVWINNDPVPSGKEFENCWDLVVKGPCDEIAKHTALRMWDDDNIGDWHEVSQKEVQEVRERSNPAVVITTPSKPSSRHTEVTGLPSPRDSPRPSIEVSRLSYENSIPSSPKFIAQTKRLAASKGRSITQILQKAAPEKPLPKKSTAKKSSASKTAPVLAKTSTAAKANQASLSFKVTKKAAVGTKKPAAFCNSVSPRGKSLSKDALVLSPLSPSAARNNTCPSHEAPEVKGTTRSGRSEIDELSV